LIKKILSINKNYHNKSALSRFFESLMPHFTVFFPSGKKFLSHGVENILTRKIIRGNFP